MHDKEDLIKKAIEAIKEYKLVFVEEIVSFLPCTKSTFYNYDLHELDAIKDILQDNRTMMKAGLRKKWYESDNATVQIALYKLIGTDEESDRINSQKVKAEHSGGIKTDTSITFKKYE